MPDHDNNPISVVDQINQRFGQHTLQFVAQGIEKPWQMQSQRRSPGYTTRWQDLPHV